MAHSSCLANVNVTSFRRSFLSSLWYRVDLYLLNNIIGDLNVSDII